MYIPTANITESLTRDDRPRLAFSEDLKRMLYLYISVTC